MSLVGVEREAVAERKKKLKSSVVHSVVLLCAELIVRVSDGGSRVGVRPWEKKKTLGDEREGTSGFGPVENGDAPRVACGRDHESAKNCVRKDDREDGGRMAEDKENILPAMMMNEYLGNG